MKKKNPAEKQTPDEATTAKLGLALSGGGFRAAFFHIGVLAQMADLGLLRHVEVISTVSGGSIIGAMYYLHVKKLLEMKPDADITDADFQKIIELIEVDFLAAVQKNIRVSTFQNFHKNLRMRRADYSRSDRIGELYDKYFYRPVVDPNRETMVEMRELKIYPKDDKKDFHPLRDNARRKAKAPILLINATTLNTGHNWRFEASRMGEPPRSSPAAMDIDKNLRLRCPPSYEDITPKQQNFELGLAVGASACVPGLFHPLAVSELYPDNLRVQLVDGGVHDNQGLQGLLEMGCTQFIISDACGQMEDDADPATKITAVVGRTNSILMDRVREEQLLRKQEEGGSRVALMHLRKGLSATAASWIGVDGVPAEESKVERRTKVTSEDFGVAREVQVRLSKIRTDLDSFTEVEAYALMADGYLMSKDELRRLSRFRKPAAGRKAGATGQWRFLRIAPWLVNPTEDFLKQLEVGSDLIFKVFRLHRLARIATLVGVAALCIGAGTLLKDEIIEFFKSSFTVWRVALAVAIVALGFIPALSRIFKPLRFLRAPAEYLERLFLRALPAALSSLFVWIHLYIYDPLFLRRGKFERLRPPE